MKKLVLTMVALVAGLALTHAQGLISINAGTAGTVQTNLNGHVGSRDGCGIV